MNQVASPPSQATGPLGPIQTIRPGLLNLLGLKQLGRLPGALADVVAPVLELKDWYLTAKRVSEVALFGGIPTVTPVNTVGFKNFAFAGANASVPQNQIWWVEEMTVQVLPAGAAVATDLVRFACGLGTSVGLNQIVSPDLLDNALAARTRDLRVHADRGFWALPGDLFSVLILDIVTTNNYTANLGLRATVLQL